MECFAFISRFEGGNLSGGLQQVWKHKQFVEEQHALHDAEAKEAVRQFWVKLGYGCVENPDDFGVDLLVEGKGRKFGCEVETKTGWHGPQFEFPTLRIPFRKQKFTDDRVTFFVLNSGRTHAAVVSRQKLLKSLVVQVKNMMVPMGTYFYEINLQDVEFINRLAE